MKFLLDVGISPFLGRLLEAEGHEFRYLPDHFSNKTPDSGILEIARQAGETIITHDLDFGKILAFSGDSMPSVILFRIHHIHAEVFHELLNQSWEHIAEPLATGALVVIETESIRIRMLPISRL
jgi:predicted nuclease of predicted toxin-antitoxin system